jgi:RNA-binding protein NOB1
MSAAAAVNGMSTNKDKHINDIGDSCSDNDNVYQYLVVDSGPIIRLTGMSTLFHRAKLFYTVPAVLQEIRDSKARMHLQNLPFVLHTKEASPEAIQAVIFFAKQTGDYASLSSVDIQVLALQYDLEKQACRGHVGHVRTTPKRTVGLGKIQSLSLATGGAEENKQDNSNDHPNNIDPNHADDADDESSTSSSEDDDDDDDEEDEEEVDHENGSSPDEEKTNARTGPLPAKSWAALVNPAAAPASGVAALPVTKGTPAVSLTTTPVVWSIPSVATPQPTLLDVNGDDDDEAVVSGQFSDAEEDDEDDVLPPPPGASVVDELALEFPSLQASLQVPYEGSDNEEDVVITDEILEQRKKASLQPVSKSGKLYNSFRNYGDLVKPKPKASPSLSTASSKETLSSNQNADVAPLESSSASSSLPPPSSSSSRIMGGMNFSGQEAMVEDDGEGWITCTKDIQTMKSTGALDPSSRVALADSSSNPQSGSCDKSEKEQQKLQQQQLLPPKSCRAACATTDFAMQNVILQMNLPLLSVDGVEVRKLKSWVQRCGACFKIYSENDNSENKTAAVALTGGRRLFCGHCGSDMMQRIACSVNGKTGRVRLHFSKKRRQPNLRGTKFSLPKPGSGNRFKGKDLLLREDQLLMGGAWNQKVKMQSGAKKNAAVSMFGTDLAASVGCNVQSTRSSASSLSLTGNNDIQVGFGRRNPNAAKGRERRGKKKKSSDKACGLRRY